MFVRILSSLNTLLGFTRRSLPAISPSESTLALDDQDARVVKSDMNEHDLSANVSIAVTPHSTIETFHHPFFQRGRKELLSRIRRKVPPSQEIGARVSPNVYMNCAAVKPCCLFY